MSLNGKIARCKTCGQSVGFITTVHVAQAWLVDAYGDYLDEVDNHQETIHPPNPGNVWSCFACDSDDVEFVTLPPPEPEAPQKPQIQVLVTVTYDEDHFDKTEASRLLKNALLHPLGQGLVTCGSPMTLDGFNIEVK